MATMALTSEQRAQWERDGFVLIRRFADPQAGYVMARETIDTIRADPPSGHRGQPAYETSGELYIQPEGKPMEGARQPEDLVAKVFNTHLSGTTREFFTDTPCGDIVGELLDSPVEVFQSMFILKNPGAWGQPWHQDSHYFNFDTTPQIGLWLAISEATLENGCLSVLPGSHNRPILDHAPDRRPGANQGYREVLGLDESTAIPVLMQPGDLLVFHSHLLHKSVDNLGGGQRQAMVLHYSRAGARNLADPSVRAVQDRVTRWLPVRQSRTALVQ